jgi:hypothetical protein
MAHVDWMIQGPKLAGCNCHYSCPCEFNAPPTDPNLCEGLEAMRIDEGWFGSAARWPSVRRLHRWPGPACEAAHRPGFIDERASRAQRALITGRLRPIWPTAFNICGSTIAKEFDPVFARSRSTDIEQRVGSFSVPGHPR